MLSAYHTLPTGGGMTLRSRGGGMLVCSRAVAAAYNTFEFNLDGSDITDHVSKLHEMLVECIK